MKIRKPKLTKLFAEYKRARQEHKNRLARDVITSIRMEHESKRIMRPTIDYTEANGSRAQLKWRGFDIQIDITIEDDADMSWCGEFCDENGRNRHHQTSGDIIKRNPSNVDRDCFTHVAITNTLESHRKWFKEHGYSKHDSYTTARSYVLRDVERMEDFNSGDNPLYAITVTASKKEVELGEASCGGFDGLDFAKTDGAWELIDEAVDSASHRLALLRGRKEA